MDCNNVVCRSSWVCSCVHRPRRPDCIICGKLPSRRQSPRFKSATAQERGLVQDFLETNCFRNLASWASQLGRHAEAVGTCKKLISLFKHRALFLQRKGEAERAVAIARLVPAFREDSIWEEVLLRCWSDSRPNRSRPIARAWRYIRALFVSCLMSYAIA